MLACTAVSSLPLVTHQATRHGRPEFHTCNSAARPNSHRASSAWHAGSIPTATSPTLNVKPRLYYQVWTVPSSPCGWAAPRGAVVVSPAQRAEMRGVISGSDGLPESKRTIRENSMPENRRPCPGVRGGAPGDPRDMAKVGLPETQPPEDASSHPPERHLKPAPVPAAGWFGTRGNPPGRRSDALSGHLRRRTGRLNRARYVQRCEHGIAYGRESYGDGVPLVVGGVTSAQSGDRESRTTGRRGTGDER